MPQESLDHQLINAALAGKAECFGELAQRYHLGLWRAARSRLGNAAAADDAVQETWLSAFKGLATYNPSYSFRTWLWTILFHQCHRAWLRNAKHAATAEPLPELWANLLDQGIRPEEAAEVREQSAQIEQFLQRLPETQADCLRLRFFGDLKFQEIADVLGCSLKTAKNRVRAGLLQLAACMGETDPAKMISTPPESSES